MKKIISLLVFSIICLSLFASFDATYSDYLFYNENDYEADFEYLSRELEKSNSDKEKAEILWRLSRTKLTITDVEKENLSEKELLSSYGDYSANDKPLASDTSSSFYYAYKSIELEETPNAYHWLASAVGRCGQVHGALNSLGKASPMRKLETKALEEFSSFSLETDSWYVLSVLYRSLPGSPISFGNDNYAISYIRKCIATQDMNNRTNGTNYLELAEQLYKRNWSQSKRAKEFSNMLKNYNKNINKGSTEYNKYYEGYYNSLGAPFYVAASLDTISDRVEAECILQYALSLINSRIPYANGEKNLEKMLNEKAEIEAKLLEWK